jgi:hypothetical protein
VVGQSLEDQVKIPISVENFLAQVNLPHEVLHSCLTPAIPIQLPETLFSPELRATPLSLDLLPPMPTADDVIGDQILQFKLIRSVGVEGVFFIQSDRKLSLKLFVGHLAPSLRQQLLEEGPIGFLRASGEPFLGQLQLLVQLDLLRKHSHQFIGLH